MKKSEKILLSVFAALFLVIVGGGVLAYFVKTWRGIVEEKDRLALRLDEMTSALAQSTEWQKRSEWLDGNTPQFGSPEQASSKLFELAQKEADATGLKIGSREMIAQVAPAEDEPLGRFDKASVRFTFAEASEETFFKWMYQLTIGTPKNFVGVTHLTLSPSASGKTVNAEVELTQYYANSAPTKLTRAK